MASLVTVPEMLPPGANAKSRVMEALLATVIAVPVERAVVELQKPVHWMLLKISLTRPDTDVYAKYVPGARLAEYAPEAFRVDPKQLDAAQNTTLPEVTAAAVVSFVTVPVTVPFCANDGVYSASVSASARSGCTRQALRVDGLDVA